MPQAGRPKPHSACLGSIASHTHKHTQTQSLRVAHFGLLAAQLSRGGDECSSTCLLAGLLAALHLRQAKVQHTHRQTFYTHP